MSLEALNGFTFRQGKSSKGSIYHTAQNQAGEKFFVNLGVGLSGELGLKLQGMTDPLTEVKPDDITIIIS